jgi:hypothetical protein
VSTTFIPGKISSEKKVLKLRSITELRAFYGSTSTSVFAVCRQGGGSGGGEVADSLSGCGGREDPQG